MRRLQFSRKEIEAVAWCIEHHMMMAPFLEMNDGRLMHWFHHPHMLDLLALMKADAAGTKPGDLGFYQKIENLYRLKMAQHREIPKPFLNGQEIMQITGLPKGKKIGEIKEQLLEKQLDREIKSKAKAIQWVKTWGESKIDKKNK